MEDCQLTAYGNLATFSKSFQTSTKGFYAERIEHATAMMFASEDVKNDRHKGANFLKAVELARDCAQEICREILRGGMIEHNTQVLYDETKSRLPVDLPITRYFTIVQTAPLADYPVSDAPDGGWDLSSLSSGVQGSVWWIRFVALNLAYYYKFAEGWEKEPAILLIDEIENHLHPTWQRRVIPALLDHFPGLQIFATTHSPFVVAGLKAGQVHLLNRDENGVVSTTTNTENIEGWTADEILRVFMGVDEPTDEPTAQAAQQLRRLRDEGPRADEREEDERQSEIARLRQIVDRAALPGPRAAEDARFLADLRSILHRYSQQQDLNQENG